MFGMPCQDLSRGRAASFGSSLELRIFVELVRAGNIPKKPLRFIQNARLVGLAVCIFLSCSDARGRT